VQELVDRWGARGVSFQAVLKALPMIDVPADVGRVQLAETPAWYVILAKRTPNFGF
jgi:hypothetical protein